MINNSDCPVCAEKMVEWKLDKNNTLLRCPACFHILRNLSEANCFCRESAWGGVGLFDKIRNYLVFKSVGRNAEKEFNDVFEIGFGGGWLLNKFRKNGKKVAGVDRDLLGVEIPEDLKANGQLFSGSAEDFVIPANQYDLVLGIHLVEHLQDPLKVFKSAYDGLRENGMLYLMTPNGNSAGLKLFKSAWWNLEDPTHCCFFSEKSITAALKSVGFRSVVVKRSFSDSMMVEINSLVRLLFTAKGNHGVLSGKFIQILDLLLLPFFLMLRLFVPSLRSTIEVIAKR